MKLFDKKAGKKASILGNFHGFCFAKLIIWAKQYSKPNVYDSNNKGNSNCLGCMFIPVFQWCQLGFSLEEF